VGEGKKMPWRTGGQWISICVVRASAAGNWWVKFNGRRKPQPGPQDWQFIVPPGCIKTSALGDVS
jgi:hypothetical protein